MFTVCYSRAGKHCILFTPVLPTVQLCSLSLLPPVWWRKLNISGTQNTVDLHHFLYTFRDSTVDCEIKRNNVKIPIDRSKLQTLGKDYQLFVGFVVELVIYFFTPRINALKPSSLRFANTPFPNSSTFQACCRQSNVCTISSYCL